MLREGTHMYMYMDMDINKIGYRYQNTHNLHNNHVHSTPQSKKEENREESHAIKQTEIHNNLNGLEKYS